MTSWEIDYKTDFYKKRKKRSVLMLFPHDININKQNFSWWDLSCQKNIMVGNRKARQRIGRREKKSTCFFMSLSYRKMQVVNMEIQTHTYSDFRQTYHYVYLHTVHSCNYKENSTSHHYFLLLLSSSSSPIISDFVCLKSINWPLETCF